MKYDIEELGDFLIVKIIGNMTANDKPRVLIDAINDYIDAENPKKFLFDLDKVEDIDDDGIDVFISCLSLQSNGIDDKDILWAQNFDEKKIEKEMSMQQVMLQSGETDDIGIEEADDFSTIADDMFSLSDIYKEEPNAPTTDCFILVKDDDVYDKLHDSGVSELMTIYRTNEDFTRDQGVTLAD